MNDRGHLVHHVDGPTAVALSPGELRLVADRLKATEQLTVQLPPQLMGVVQRRRTARQRAGRPGASVLAGRRFCTWSPACGEFARHWMERRDPTVTVVEAVCGTHRAAAEADGYRRRQAPVYCDVCRQRIRWVQGRWRHHEDNLPYSSIGGSHWATPADDGLGGQPSPPAGPAC